MNPFLCLLCSKSYDTKKKLQNHERNKHKNNKIIPHHHILYQPSNETLSFYRDTVIIRLKNSLGFNRHSIGRGGERLKNIFNYDQIVFCENLNTSTRGYILFEDNEGQYKATFSWKQKERRENQRIFLTGTLSINFITNSGEFVNE